MLTSQNEFKLHSKYFQKNIITVDQAGKHEYI